MTVWRRLPCNACGYRHDATRSPCPPFEGLHVIFLDFDGVLNSVETFRERKAARERGDAIEDGSSIDRGLIARLNRLIERTGAKVVISSSWRCFARAQEPKTPVRWLQKLLDSRGFKGEVIGSTPELPSPRVRGDEIQSWLTRDGGDVRSFVILDDETDMAHLKDRLVLTTFATGLQEHHLSMAVAVLRKPLRRPARRRSA